MGLYQYGLYSFSFTVVSFLAIFFGFGYFSSGAKMLADNKNNITYENAVLRAMGVIMAIMSVLFVITTLFLSFVVDYIFQDKIGYILRFVSPVSFAFIVPFFLDRVLKGCGKIKELSFFNISWKSQVLLYCLALFCFDSLQAKNVLLVTCIAALISFGCIYYNIGFKMNHLHDVLINIHKMNVDYGRHMYIARIIGVSSCQVDKLLVAFFVGVKELGLYNMASLFANTVVNFSTALSASSFKQLAKSTCITKNILLYNYIGATVSAFGSFMAITLTAHFILGEEFYESVYLSVILISAIVFQSLYQPYNIWLSLNGPPSILKRISLLLMFTAISADMLLIPLLKSYGAALAMLIFMLVAYALYKKEYHKLAMPSDAR
jgi:O-antigen/teichoic acid export membrane protein